MSEHRVAVVRVDALGALEAERLAEAVERDLRAAGVLGEPYDGEEPVLAPDAARLWTAGPALADLAPSGDDLLGVSALRQMVHAFGNVEPARCGRCGTALAPDADAAAAGAWVEDREPRLVCAVCGWAAPYGDWPSGFPSAVGAPLVSFHLGRDPEPALLESVAARLGGRATVVRTHL